MGENKVVVEKRFNAPLSLVWSIWTNPEFIKIWFGSDPDGIVLSADIDLSVGGKYSVAFENSDGSFHNAFGEYLEIIEFSKLRLSWEWKSEPGHISELMVELIPQAEQTLCILTHFNLYPNSLHGYKDGWNSTMNKIVKKIIEK